MSNPTLNEIHEKYNALEKIIGEFSKCIINRPSSVKIPGKITVDSDDRTLVNDGFGQKMTAKPRILVTEPRTDFFAVYVFHLVETDEEVCKFHLSSKGDVFVTHKGSKTEYGRYDDYVTVEKIHGNAISWLLASKAFQ